MSNKVLYILMSLVAVLILVVLVLHFKNKENYYSTDNVGECVVIEVGDESGAKRGLRFDMEPADYLRSITRERDKSQCEKSNRPFHETKSSGYLNPINKNKDKTIFENKWENLGCTNELPSELNENVILEICQENPYACDYFNNTLTRVKSCLNDDNTFKNIQDIKKRSLKRFCRKLKKGKGKQIDRQIKGALVDNIDSNILEDTITLCQ